MTHCGMPHCGMPVDNEKTGMLLLTKGGLQRRVTLIPLNKIKATTASPAQLQQVHKLVGDRAAVVVSLISCAAELQPARLPASPSHAPLWSVGARY